MYTRCGQCADAPPDPHARRGFCPAAEEPPAGGRQLSAVLGCALAAGRPPLRTRASRGGPREQGRDLNVQPFDLNKITTSAQIHQSSVPACLRLGGAGITIQLFHYHFDPYGHLTLQVLCCLWKSPHWSRGDGWSAAC